MSNQKRNHDLIHEMIEDAKSGKDAHSIRRLLVSQVAQIIELVETEGNGTIVTNNVVDWLVGFLKENYPERDWDEDQFWIYQTVDTFLMLTYDTQAAMIYSHTREVLIESQTKKRTH